MCRFLFRQSRHSEEAYDYKGSREELLSVFSLYASPLPDPTVPFHANLELVEPTPDATKYPRHGNLTPEYRYTHPSPSFRSRCKGEGGGDEKGCSGLFSSSSPWTASMHRDLYCRSFLGWCSLYNSACLNRRRHRE